MADFFIIDSDADRIDLIDAINERLAKTRAITSCLLAVSDNIELTSETICLTSDAIYGYLLEITQLFDVLIERYEKNNIYSNNQ